jgi:hypothetical protein
MVYPLKPKPIKPIRLMTFEVALMSQFQLGSHNDVKDLLFINQTFQH